MSMTDIFVVILTKCRVPNLSFLVFEVVAAC